MEKKITQEKITDAKYFMLWYGGCNYAQPSARDAEPVASIAEAVRLCRKRRNDTYFPCAYEGLQPGDTVAWLVSDKYCDYPDYTIVLGKRGGFHVEKHCY